MSKLQCVTWKSALLNGGQRIDRPPWGLDISDLVYWPSLSLSPKGIRITKAQGCATALPWVVAPPYSGFNPERVASRSIPQPQRPRSLTGHAKRCNPCQG